MNRSHVIEALRAADWSNTPIGNKALIQAAIEHLEAQPSSAFRPARVSGYRPGMGEVTVYVAGGVPGYMNIGDTVYVSDRAPGEQPSAALARVAELEAKLDELEKQKPLLHINPLVVDELLGRAKRSPGVLTGSKEPCRPWTLPLYTAPAQAQHSVPGIAESVSECLALAQTVFARLEGLMPRGKKLPEKHVARRLLAELETLAKLAAAPSEKRFCEYSGCSDKAHPGTSLCIAHHSKKAREQLLAATTDQGDAQ
ncbi:hypothetical protein FA223_13255 [Pseudomonas aeruginosa]|nr:hypothetical protein [Pseudomonas aeruginosa]